MNIIEPFEASRRSSKRNSSASAIVLPIAQEYARLSSYKTRNENPKLESTLDPSSNRFVALWCEVLLYCALTYLSYLKFLECVWNLTQMYPRYFEFNTQLLLALAEHMCSGLYGTFICNSQGERMSKITDVETKTASFWSHVHAQHESYQNPIYKPEGSTGAFIRLSLSHVPSLTHTQPGVLPGYQHVADIRRLSLWKEFYFRWSATLQPVL